MTIWATTDITPRTDKNNQLYYEIRCIDPIAKRSARTYTGPEYRNYHMWEGIVHGAEAAVFEHHAMKRQHLIDADKTPHILWQGAQSKVADALNNM